jgi:hypothetical protein
LFGWLLEEVFSDGLGLVQGEAELAVGAAGDGVAVVGLDGDAGGDSQPDVDRLLSLGGQVAQ